MPKFTFLCHLVDFEVCEFVYFVFELDDESDLGGSAEVTDDQEADDFQEVVSTHQIFVSPYLSQIFDLDGHDLHDVAYVQVLHPFSLIQESQDVTHVRFR